MSACRQHSPLPAPVLPPVQASARSTSFSACARSCPCYSAMRNTLLFPDPHRFPIYRPGNQPLASPILRPQCLSVIDSAPYPHKATTAYTPPGWRLRDFPGPRPPASPRQDRPAPAQPQYRFRKECTIELQTSHGPSFHTPPERRRLSSTHHGDPNTRFPATPASLPSPSRPRRTRPLPTSLGSLSTPAPTRDLPLAPSMGRVTPTSAARVPQGLGSGAAGAYVSAPRVGPRYPTAT